ncbi:uncharacterized protein LOC116934893 [Daphnia magna]|uniref:uncharacterized protein LOC116934893 n=1 Tax=Daphnia magna TaxID=35525 RepID=UPI001E1BC405|nr:uncharacterized protein LOC116934893 [Daphnia magna]
MPGWHCQLPDPNYYFYIPIMLFYCTLRADVSKMKKMLPSKEDHQQCKINGLEYLISFYNLCPLIISSSFYFYLNSHHMSSPRPSPSLGFTRRHIFASPRLRSVRRPVFASSVAPSSLRPSPRLRFSHRIASSLWYRCIL